MPHTFWTGVLRVPEQLQFVLRAAAFTEGTAIRKKVHQFEFKWGRGWTDGQLFPVFNEVVELTLKGCWVSVFFSALVNFSASVVESSSSQTCPDQCPTGWVFLNSTGYCYVARVHSSKNQCDAAKACQSNDSRLLDFDDFAEWQAVTNSTLLTGNLRKSVFTWFGLVGQCSLDGRFSNATCVPKVAGYGWIRNISSDCKIVEQASVTWSQNDLFKPWYQSPSQTAVPGIFKLPSGRGMCTVIQYDAAHGLVWTDVPCSGRERRHYFCETGEQLLLCKTGSLSTDLTWRARQSSSLKWKESAWVRHSITWEELHGQI